MQYRQRKALEALRSVQAYLDNHTDRLGDVNAGGARTTLNGVVGKLDEMGGQQDPTKFQRRSEIQAEENAEIELRESHMQPIARVARLELQTKPEFEKLRMPHSSVDLTTLVTWAREMAKAAGPYTATFVANGLAPDFIAKMEAAAETVRKAVNARSSARHDRVGATREVHKQSRRAIGVLGVLDALVRPKVKDDDQLLRGWASARRVARRAAKNAAEATDPGAGTSSSAPVTNAPVTDVPVSTPATTVPTSEATTTPAATPAAPVNKKSSSNSRAPEGGGGVSP